MGPGSINDIYANKGEGPNYRMDTVNEHLSLIFCL